MTEIENFATDVLTAKQGGWSTWNGWYSRLSCFREWTFGADWKTNEKDLFEKWIK